MKLFTSVLYLKIQLMELNILDQKLTTGEQWEPLVGKNSPI